jgi:DNA-binding transcriptional regulator PaaX
VVHDRIDEIRDLDSPASEYQGFLEATEGERPDSPEEAFAALLRLVHRWRHFPGRDPGLPDHLLPPTWPAAAAAEMFRVRRAEWSGYEANSLRWKSFQKLLGRAG